jgi:hypothetical protein
MSRLTLVPLETVEAIIGNNLPGLLYHGLARTGYDSQRHDRAEDRLSGQSLGTG